MASLLIVAVLTVVIANTVIYTESVPDNCTNKWSLNIEGLSENETIVEYSQKVDPKSSVRMSWHWKSKNNEGKWTSTYIRTLNRGIEHGTFHYSNSLTNHSAMLRWEISPENFLWKSFGVRVIPQPAWNITVCDSIQWGFVPGVGSFASWSFHVGNTVINSGDKHNKNILAGYPEKVTNREKRQTSGTNPRNILEWFNGVVNDIFGTGRSFTTRIWNILTSLLFMFGDHGMEHNFNETYVSASDESITPDPDAEWISSV